MCFVRFGTSLEMAEAIGLAIGAIGLVPPTVALIQCCTSFYGDIVHTDQAAREFVLKFEGLASRYDSTQRLLFEKGKFAFAWEGLFQELSARDQRIIYAMLQALPRLLYSFYVLEKSYRVKALPNPPQDQDPALTSEALRLLFDDSLKPVKSERTSILSSKGWRWTIRGNARAERLLLDFEDSLRRIRNLIEDACFPLSLLQSPANLKVVEIDPDAVQLGVAQPAKLRRLVLLESAEAKGLEIVRSSLKIEPLNARREIGSLDGDRVLVEMLPYPMDSDGFMPALLESRFSTIAGLLQQAQDPDFRVLPCKGYIKVTYPTPQLQLVYGMPAGALSPENLLQKVTTSASMKPSLGARVRLGHQLALSLSLMHSVGWIHRGLRSDNILLLGGTSGLENPKLCGFEASRLEGDFSSGPYDNDIALDVYRHPHRWGTPKKPFNKYHDIYGECTPPFCGLKTESGRSSGRHPSGTGPLGTSAQDGRQRLPQGLSEPRSPGPGGGKELAARSSLQAYHAIRQGPNLWYIDSEAARTISGSGNPRFRYERTDLPSRYASRSSLR